jgi:signal transduction histidine kinase
MENVMPQWLSEALEKSNYFMPHGHCYLWLPGLLWLHVGSDVLIGTAYLGISVILYVLVRKIRLPFSPVFIAFGLFIGLCGITHFMKVWTVWHPDYLIDGLIKAATAAASVATAIGLFYVKPQVEEVVDTARLSEERRIRLESAHAELESLYNKVKELDVLRMQFFANVSHELRTPLALILGPAERLLADSALTPDQRRQLERISSNGKTLLKQVNDLLDVARLDAGKMQIRYARLDMAAMCRRIASQFELAAEQRQLHFRLAAPASLTVVADPDMLERVLINLLSNAFKFTPAGGQVLVELHGGNDEFSFSVADSGSGIEPDQRALIFERFRQADGGATRLRGGTGLGLAIVKDFVDLHHGRIEVGEREGGGAIFTVHMPASAPGAAELQDAAPAAAPASQVALEGTLHQLDAEFGNAAATQPWPALPGRPSVLVVEDNPDMNRFVAETLSEQYNVITACDGQEGLHSALALHPDLIVTDIMMPRMSGDQLVEAVRARSELKAVPVLLLTARADDALRIKLLQGGAQDYLTKPFLPQELRARAANLVAIKRAGDALRMELSSASGDVDVLAQELAERHRQLQTALAATAAARAQAERATEVKSLFLSMASHELRTPLSAIQMNTQLLQRYDDTNASPSARTRVERVARATRQMQALVEGLLEYTRVEAGPSSAYIEPVDTVALAQEVVESHLHITPSTVRLVLDPPPPDLPVFGTDPHLLRVLLSNLVSNALKFTRQGTVSVRLSEAGGERVFEVHDTGIGIPAADIPRMFLPFEQLEPVRRKSIPGFGLGLALVKHIVDALGGRLEVSSEVGAGSVFRVRLPDPLLENNGLKETCNDGTGSVPPDPRDRRR